MTSKDNKRGQRVEAYLETEFQRYVNWYVQNAKISKNNLIAALVVVVVCALLLVFFPGPMDEMSFLQYRFDPTLAIKLGLLASILLALHSMYASFKRLRHCLATGARLQTALSQFEGRDPGDADAKNDVAFQAFKSNVDAIMAVANPELVVAVARDNAQKKKSS